MAEHRAARLFGTEFVTTCGATLRVQLYGCRWDVSSPTNWGSNCAEWAAGNVLLFPLVKSVCPNGWTTTRRVSWHVCDEPWKLEEELISAVRPPMNLHLNDTHAFG